MKKPPRWYRGGFFNFNQKPESRISPRACLRRFPLTGRSGEVEAVRVHHPGPRLDEVLRKLLLGVRASIDFRDGAELGMRTEDQVDACSGPLHRPGLAVAALVLAIGASRPPFRAHVE